MSGYNNYTLYSVQTNFINYCFHGGTRNWPFTSVLRFLATGQGTGTVRLSRSGFTSTWYTSGRVQIYRNQWGNICDDIQFGLTEARVICHQLGYTGASSQSRQSSDT